MPGAVQHHNVWIPSTNHRAPCLKYFRYTSGFYRKKVGSKHLIQKLKWRLLIIQIFVVIDALNNFTWKWVVYYIITQLLLLQWVDSNIFSIAGFQTPLSSKPPKAWTVFGEEDGSDDIIARDRTDRGGMAAGWPRFGHGPEVVCVERSVWCQGRRWKAAAAELRRRLCV